MQGHLREYHQEETLLVAQDLHQEIIEKDLLTDPTIDLLEIVVPEIGEE